MTSQCELHIRMLQTKSWENYSLWRAINISANDLAVFSFLVGKVAEL